MICSLKKYDSLDGAAFSDCSKYRYALWRTMDEKKPSIMFIGLNPSLANETTDDPTIRRVKSFAEKWGYGKIYMLNLFAYITPYPNELRKCDAPIGEKTDLYLQEIRSKCEEVIFAWGDYNSNGRDKSVVGMFPNGKALFINKNGTPRHPLYVPRNVVPQPFGL